MKPIYVVFKKLPATNYPPAKFGKFTEYLQPLCHGQPEKSPCLLHLVCFGNFAKRTGLNKCFLYIQQQSVFSC